jgi:DinB superfamily
VERCDECGFEYDLGSAPTAGPAIVAGVARFALLLDGSPSGVARRPRPDTWSPLEYGCHLRDVLLVQRERVLSARRTDRPEFEPMGRDERVEHDGYAEQDPDAVARQMTDAAALFAHVLARLDHAGWDRPVIYSYPARQERTLRWVAVHTVHEVDHHLLDVRRQLDPGFDGA